jgi:hypothetical protein
MEPKKRGGARAGAGRKPMPDKIAPTSLVLTESIKNKIDKLAEQDGQNRSQVVRDILTGKRAAVVC